MGVPRSNPSAHGMLSIPMRTPTTSKEGHIDTSIGVHTVVIAPTNAP